MKKATLYGDSEEREALQVAAHDMPAPEVLRRRGSWQVAEHPHLPPHLDIDEEGEITLDPLAVLAEMG